MGGGGGGGGETKYNWNDAMAPLWTQALGQAGKLADNPFPNYMNGDVNYRVAPLSGDTLTAMNQIRGYTTDPQYSVQDPNQAQNAGINLEKDTLNGKYLNADPYAGASDPYLGNSQYYRNVINNGMADIARQYQLGTAADTTRMFNQAGAFGGSAYQNAVGANEYGLAKELGNYSDSMLNDQMNRSGQLYQQDMNRGSQAYQDAANRQSAMIQPAQNEQNLAFQRAAQLMGIGDISRSYNQDVLNQNYNNFMQQYQWPQSQLDWLTGVYSRAQGGVAANSTTQTSGYSASPYSSILGGLLGAGALFGGK